MEKKSQEEREQEMKAQAHAAYTVGAEAVSKALPTALGQSCLFFLLLPVICIACFGISFYFFNSTLLGIVFTLIALVIYGIFITKRNLKKSKEMADKMFK